MVLSLQAGIPFNNEWDYFYNPGILFHHKWVYSHNPGIPFNNEWGYLCNPGIPFFNKWVYTILEFALIINGSIFQWWNSFL